MKVNFKVSALAAAVMMTVASGAASAASINSLIKYDGTSNQLHDLDRTYLVNRNGGATTLDVGDSLRGMINFTIVNGQPVGGAPGVTNDQLTAIFQVEIIGKVQNGDGSFTFTLGSDPTFGTTLGSGNLATANPGVAAVLYTNPARTFLSDDGTFATNPGENLPGTEGSHTVEDYIQTSVTGGRWETFGFTGTTLSGGLTDGSVTANTSGGKHEIWTTTAAGDDIAAFANFGTGAPLGQTFLALNKLNNGADTGPQTLGTVISQPGLQEGQLVGRVALGGISDIAPTHFQSSSDGDFTIIAFAPLPDAAPMGFALLSAMLGGMGLRKMRRA